MGELGQELARELGHAVVRESVVRACGATGACVREVVNGGGSVATKSRRKSRDVTEGAGLVLANGKVCSSKIT